MVSLAPAEAQVHFGWFAVFASMNAHTASQNTREKLSWRPQQPGLLADMLNGHYFPS